jgi:hypothetical protein
MDPRVAVVKTDGGVAAAYQEALRLIGGIADLDGGPVTVKIGIYDQRNGNYPTVPVVQAVTDGFPRAPRIYLAESANHHGAALDRLRVWQDVYSDRVVPYDLSHDPQPRDGTVCGEPIRFAHVLCKPHRLVSLHVLREGQAGAVFKNLLGAIPDTRKERFHERLGACLIDIAEAVGWIDLAVIDGTYRYGRDWKEGVALPRTRANLLVVGRDPVAVETVGSVLVDEDPTAIPAIDVAAARGLGEADLARIEVVGEPLDRLAGTG